MAARLRRLGLHLYSLVQEHVGLQHLRLVVGQTLVDHRSVRQHPAGDNIEAVCAASRIRARTALCAEVLHNTTQL